MTDQAASSAHLSTNLVIAASAAPASPPVAPASLLSII
jgi:hypothetical protein